MKRKKKFVFFLRLNHQTRFLRVKNVVFFSPGIHGVVILRGRDFFLGTPFFIISFMLKNEKKSLPLKIICHIASK